MGGERRLLGLRPGRRRRALPVCAAVLTATLSVSGCQGQVVVDQEPTTSGMSSPSPTTSTESVAVGRPLLALRFSGGPGGRFDNAGDAPLRVEPVGWGTGVVRRARSPLGPAVRLPAYHPTPTEFAVIRVTNLEELDWLRPADANFAFGAAFSVDRVSTGGVADNGDNLIQRGLYETPSLYKLQVDRRRISCLVRGLSGEVLVEARDLVRPGQWYRARCERRGDSVSLKYALVHRDRSLDLWTTVTKRGPTGPVIMPVQTPLSIGGKLAGDGSLLATSTDQFNGAIDRVSYRLLR